MLSILIDAHEGRDVGTADVAGAYLKAYMDDYVLMKFTGASVGILCAMNAAHAHKRNRGKWNQNTLTSD
jgi:hypothetical protein